MINTNRRYRISCILCTWNIKNSILPMTRLSFTISKCVHSEPLPSTLMPGSFIPMPIRKLIDPKTMHLVCKIFSSIHVPISEWKKLDKFIPNTPCTNIIIAISTFQVQNKACITATSINQWITNRKLIYINEEGSHSYIHKIYGISISIEFT